MKVKVPITADQYRAIGKTLNEANHELNTLDLPVHEFLLKVFILAKEKAVCLYEESAEFSNVDDAVTGNKE